VRSPFIALARPDSYPLVVLLKLDHTLAGIYIWEIAFTMGFELEILRGKRPYRWTIWLYLGTRYVGLASFIVFFIDTDGGKVPCHPLIVANYTLPYISWAFASLIIVLRVQVLFQHCMAAQDAECASFQHCDMASPYYRIVNCGLHMVGWSRAQSTKSSNGGSVLRPGFGVMHHASDAQRADQRHRRPGRGHSAPHDHADRTPETLV
jgi:hypothetical protein